MFDRFWRWWGIRAANRWERRHGPATREKLQAYHRRRFG